MAESDVIQQIARSGVGGLIAIFVFLLYRRDLKDAKTEAAALAGAFKEQAAALGVIVQANTRVMAQLEGTNAHLARTCQARAESPKEGPHGRR